jgi:hypothetical protein
MVGSVSADWFQNSKRGGSIRVNGYLRPGYAESLEFGTPRELPRCGGWVLERQIPGFPDQDAMGGHILTERVSLRIGQHIDGE